MTDRTAFTVRLPKTEYEALQSLYYATIKDHRLSFNGWINAIIGYGVQSEFGYRSPMQAPMRSNGQ